MRGAPRYLWRRSASEEWLRENEARLRELAGNALAIIERPGRKRMLLEVAGENRAKAEKLTREFAGRTATLPARWIDGFLKASRGKPLPIGKRLVIETAERKVERPRRTLPGCARTLIIPAGAAFGTGEHATTAMSLRLLERVTRHLAGGWRMLDAGSGSGILALAARCFGAQDVVAIDNDPVAISTARENARRNRIRGVKFMLGDVRRACAGRFDVIAANLHSELLQELLCAFRRCLRGDGRLLMSGVLRPQEAQLRRALRRNGFRVLEVRRRGKWIALLCSGR
ncbi:MAG: 50S ribosomal protein L11 methyltransferase [Chthoniobacterales bacterium]